MAVYEEMFQFAEETCSRLRDRKRIKGLKYNKEKNGDFNMCKVIDFNEYRGNKDTKGEVRKVGQAKGGVKKKNTGGLSTEALIKEYVQNGKSVLKLVLYIIEQYGCFYNSDTLFKETKRDVRYCDIYPEIENKRLKAPLAVKIKGEWCAVEVITNSSGDAAFKKKWETIGNYNVKGFSVYVSDLGHSEMTYWLDRKEQDIWLGTIVEKIHDFYFYNKRVVPFERMSIVEINGEDTRIKCIYKMKELSLPDYVILEGTEIETGDKHMLLLHKGNKKKKYAEYYREKYADAGIPLFYARWRSGITNDWKSEMMNGSRVIYRSLRGN